MAVAVQMKHTVDPKKEIWDDVKPYLDDVEPIGTEVLLAVYLRPERTAGGIIVDLGDKGMKAEDRYQGKVGLVLKMGPVAFTEDDRHHWGGRIPQVGDWLAVSVGDTWSCELGNRRCRIVEDIHCKLILQRPDIVY